MENVLRLIRFNPLYPPKMEQYCIVATEVNAHSYPDVYRWDAANGCFRRRSNEFAVMPGPGVYWAPLPKVVLFDVENSASASNRIGVR